NLVHIFEKLDFEVEVHDDLTARDMYTCLGNIGERDHMPYSCFVCCILSHGTAGKVYGVDGIPIEISHLTSCVKGIPCRSLIGKPKLFFIQACQGQRAQRGDIVMDHDGDQDEIPMSIPNEADFLLGYATVPGFVSYRSKTQGSWYITKLVECLDRYHNEYELLDIMRKVNEEVAKAIAATKDGERKQVPAPQFTLRKRLFLKPVEIF
ncbi:caspase-8-like, partial [Saccoglossus kowalevskii]|uniref:Caspase-8-like n=1 Tax=Saccoglossus kowalevskii TaxID=10224 RepID=A0ABM0GLJ6_SACKO